MDFFTFLFLLDILGTFVFALSGAVAGVKKKMDIFGMSVLAVVTASGGGMLRSVLIGDTPVSFLQNPWYIIAAIFATIFVFLFRHYFFKHTKTILFFDALGLGVFVSIGITIALANGLTFWASILLGVITACFGGVLRDVLSVQVPLIFRKELYATVCFIGGFIYVCLLFFTVSKEIVITASFLTVFIVRVLAMKYKWSLPR